MRGFERSPLARLNAIACLAVSMLWLWACGETGRAIEEEGGKLEPDWEAVRVDRTSGTVCSVVSTQEIDGEPVAYIDFVPAAPREHPRPRGLAVSMDRESYQKAQSAYSDKNQILKVRASVGSDTFVGAHSPDILRSLDTAFFHWTDGLLDLVTAMRPALAAA